MSDPSSSKPKLRRLRGALLWILAFVLMASAGRYQRHSGPTYPLAGKYQAGGTLHAYELIRSGLTDEGAPVELEAWSPELSAEIHWRRYPTRDEFAVLPMLAEDSEDGSPRLAARLPVQPAAGKLEYFIVLQTGAEEIRIPAVGDGRDVHRVEGADAEDTIILRYKNPVPLPLLLAHVLMMFLSMMVGLRTAFAAIFEPQRLRRLTTVTLIGISIGGLVLGPCVQKIAFGAFWTGWPYGYDLTDNKTLIMALVWMGAFLVVQLRPKVTRAQRIAVLVATVVMLAVYLIPHSLRGSELDYEQLEQGIEAEDAVRTG